MPDHGIFEKVDIHGAIPGFIIRHTRPGSSVIKNHWHPELEINTAFEGTSRFFINGRIEDVTPAHIVLINSREVHSSIPFFPTEGFAVTGITLQISYPFLKSVIPNFDNCYFVLNDAAGQRIQERIFQLNTLLDSQDTALRNLLSIQIICDILSLLLRECRQQKPKTEDSSFREHTEKLEEILLFIHSHFKQSLRSAEVAQHFFFSKEYFCRFFKKYTGFTFYQYLTKYRVIQAGQLLTETSMKISEIAQESGFSDEGSFIQAFRKYQGCTPGNYRKELRQSPSFRKD